MTETKTNRYEGNCESCGIKLLPGEGRLEFIPDAHDNDDFDRVGTTREKAHWEVYCLDGDACRARVDEAKKRHDAERAEAKRIRDEEAAAKKADQEAKQAVWATMTAGLERTEAEPVGFERTGEFADSGKDETCEKIKLPSGEFGWLVSWIGDMDGHYWLVPAAAKESAEAEKQRLHRIYQWWRPGTYNAKDYPGPGVPESELTEDERAEVERCTVAKFADVEADWTRNINSAIKPGTWKGAKGCEAWEILTAVGAEVEIVTDPEEFRAFCRAYEGTKIYSKERDELKLIVTLRAKLPGTARNKNGSVKAAIQQRLPREWHNRTNNRFVFVQVEYV